MKGLFWFCLSFLVSPGLTLVPKPAECLVFGVYELIRLPVIKDGPSCYQDCLDEPNCHMAVVSNPLRGPSQCLLVNCLNQGLYWLPRNPTAEISVYPKATMDNGQRVSLMKGAYGLANERLRCFGFKEDSSCELKTPRFFYNKDASSCEQVSSGCGSNRTTFDTREACETFCNERRVCYRPVEYGENPPLRFSNVSPIRGKPDENSPHNFFFHNMSSFRCEGFTFRGSLSNGNLFRTVEECEELCGDVKVRCFDFMEHRSRGPRFFYNSTSYRCEQVSSGSGTNRNTFDTLEGCEALCNEKYRCYRPVEHGQRPPFRFSQELPETGKPDASALHNFFYNVSSFKCEGFHFRGSASNGNIFRTMEQCERLCGDVKVTAKVPVSNAATAVTPTVKSGHNATTANSPPLDADTTMDVPTEKAVATTSQPVVDSDTTVTPSADSGPAQKTDTTRVQPRALHSDPTVVVSTEWPDVSAPVSRNTAAMFPILYLSISLLLVLVIAVKYLRRIWYQPPIGYTRV